MNEVLISICTGLFVGVLFSAIKLPLPAPPVLPGVLGIVGIYGGGLLFQMVSQHFFS